MKNIQNEVIDTVKLAFVISIAITVSSKFGFDTSWLTAFFIGPPIGIIIAIIIIITKSAESSRD